MDHLVKAGLVPMVTPVLVREMALFGTGFFPGDRQQVYEIPADELFLAATSEISLAAYHADEILEPDQLPIRYAGFSSCFRREAGTHGKDTGGIFRVHQFDKVEMFSFTRPEDLRPRSTSGFWRLEEKLTKELEIPYRVVNVAAGDLGASAAKKYDIEAWFPSWNTYRGDNFLLQHHRLPGPTTQDPHEGAGGQPIGPHAERNGGGGGQSDHRPVGEPSAKRRFGGDARSAPALSGLRSYRPTVGTVTAPLPRTHFLADIPAV